MEDRIRPQLVRTVIRGSSCWQAASNWSVA